MHQDEVLAQELIHDDSEELSRLGAKKLPTVVNEL